MRKNGAKSSFHFLILKRPHCAYSYRTSYIAQVLMYARVCSVFYTSSVLRCYPSPFIGRRGIVLRVYKPFAKIDSKCLWDTL